MTKADLIDEVSKLAELTRKDSEVIVETIFDSIVRSLRVGDKIEIRGFGSFRTRQRKPRVGRNPRPASGGSPGEEDSFLQAQQRVERPGQYRRRTRRQPRRLPPQQRPRRGRCPTCPAERSSATQPPEKFQQSPQKLCRALNVAAPPSPGSRNLLGPALPGLK
jgi:nucleoid DNA-binding protein